MARTWYNDELTLDSLKDETISVIGYGIQGAAQASNLKDSGLNVIVGTRKDGKGWEQAIKDGHVVKEIPDAAQAGSIIHLLIPDMAQPKVYESEIKRISSKTINLSELYPVYFEYIEKAKGYINTRGKTHLGEGSETNAVQRMMEMYGIVPFEAFEGKPTDQPFYNHEKMFSEIETYLRNCKSTNFWDEETILSNIKSILNHYMGIPPTSFKYEGKTYTPKSFLKNVTKLKPTDYVDFMSLLQKPYWSQEEYKVPDNWWRSADYYNVPLDEFMFAIKNAIKNGYSISIGGDVSESGYSSTHDVAMVPSYDIPSEYIDENARQFRFSNGTTTDDHAIHLIGYKIDTNEDWWFLIKDSGSGSRNGRFPGYYFYHEDFVKLKMMTFTIHKNAVKETLDKFNK